MAVLVTGGAGYIGSHTVVALHDAGRRIVVLDNLSNSSERAVEAMRALTGSNLPFVQGDAADVDLVSRTIVEHDVDEVVHFAAFKSVSDSVQRPLAYFANNMGSLVGVVQAMEATGVRRMVFSSSCTVYGEPDEVPVTEESPTAATNPYGWTKLHGEQFLEQVAAGGGLDVMILRYFNPVGAHPSGTMGDDPHGAPANLVPYLMQVAAGRLDRLPVFGADYDTPDGSPVRDYLHVVDLAEGHVAALDTLPARPGCRAINLGTGRGYSVLEVVAAAEQALGRPVAHEVVARRPGDVARIWAGTNLAKRLLGWTASRGLTEMLVDHWRWQEAHPDGYGN